MKLSGMTRSIKRDADESCMWVIPQAFEEIRAGFLPAIQQCLLLQVSLGPALFQTFLLPTQQKASCWCALALCLLWTLPVGKPASTTQESSQRSRQRGQLHSAGLAGINAGVPVVLALRCQVGCTSTAGEHAEDSVLQESRKRLN